MCPISQAYIAAVVDVFYERVRADEALSKPFGVVEDWPHHNAIISHFWWLTLGGERYLDYDYHVVPKHRAVGFTPELLHQNWLPLFEQTVREQLEPELAEIWLSQAQRIGRSLHLMHDFWLEKVAQSI